MRTSQASARAARSRKWAASASASRNRSSDVRSWKDSLCAKSMARAQSSFAMSAAFCSIATIVRPDSSAATSAAPSASAQTAQWYLLLLCQVHTHSSLLTPASHWGRECSTAAAEHLRKIQATRPTSVPTQRGYDGNVTLGRQFFRQPAAAGAAKRRLSGMTPALAICWSMIFSETDVHFSGSCSRIPRRRAGRRNWGFRRRWRAWRRCAAIHPHLNVLAFDGDVLGDRGENFLAQKGEQIGLAARGPLVGQQDLKPLPRDRAVPRRRNRLRNVMLLSVRTACRASPCGRWGWSSARRRP